MDLGLAVFFFEHTFLATPVSRADRAVCMIPRDSPLDS